jgi:hypothetical protein
VLELNLLWHHALAVEAGAAHVCQTTLHSFRQRLLGSDRAKGVCRTVTQALVEADGLTVACQRWVKAPAATRRATLPPAQVTRPLSPGGCTLAYPAAPMRPYSSSA